ncbi:tetratricopeptide repeat protein [Chitinophaga agrisoli]|uniref:Tetratricopeptide repeat protein n=1 Tax=Chitinophaga agrisoli TaxID=2607653 RepID=A0A5B2W2B2_9BACT|nr:tetratricopeptide repeat protein [Chitinophaga agrisoli]KAA2245204.1 tetratricopeptide repeat protein [Chitinophaga agrisoli]
MRKSQVLLVGTAVALLVVLLAFGRTIPRPDKNAMPTAAAPMMGGGQDVKSISFSDLLASAKAKVPAEKLLLINSLENKVVRGDVKHQQIAAFKALYSAWDSLNQMPVAAHYLGEAAKLENSEKSLTFAANLFLEHLQHAQESGVMKWEANEAIQLLDQAITLSPDNDSLKIQQALVYMNTGEPMVGVQKLRAIVAEHPDNIEAQLTLGNLAIQSGQYDKAIERMETLLQKHPEEAKVYFVLAEAYRSKGDVKKAVALFQQCKSLLKDPELKAEIDGYIKSIQ